jgi:hypothetical protein
MLPIQWIRDHIDDCERRCVVYDPENKDCKKKCKLQFYLRRRKMLELLKVQESTEK